MNTNKRKSTENKELLKLVIRIKEGDETAFQDFYESTYQHLTFYLSQFTSDIEQQKDLLQETYLSAHKNFYQLKDDMAVMGWLRSIARNKWVDSVRKEHLQFVSYEDTEIMQDTEEDNIDALPECKMDKEECTRLLIDIIQNLDESQRYLITEFYYNKRKIKDIAKELQISEGTVKSNLSRTRTLIKEKILELEKKYGTRIYSVNIGSLLLLFFQYGEEIYVVPDAIQTFSNQFTKNIIKNTTDKIKCSSLKVGKESVKSSLLGTIKGKVIFMALKGKIIAATIAGVAVVGGTTGAIYATTTSNNIEQVKNSIVVEAGEELDIEAKDFLESKKESNFAKVNLDVTGINVDKVGEYELKATFGKNEYIVTVTVQDTVAPNVTIAERVLYVSDLKKVDYTDMGVTVYDASEFKTNLKLVEKLGTLEETSDEGIAKLVSGIKTPCDQKELSELKGIKKVKENGIYRGVLEYIDEQNNTWYEEILVVYNNPKLVVAEEPKVEEQEETKVEESKEDIKSEEKEVVETKKEEPKVEEKVEEQKEEVKVEDKKEEPEVEEQKEETPLAQETTPEPQPEPEENKVAQSEPAPEPTPEPTPEPEPTSEPETTSEHQQEQKPAPEPEKPKSEVTMSDVHRETVNAGYYNVIVDSSGRYSVLVRGDEFDKGCNLIEDYLRPSGLEPRDIAGGWIDLDNDWYRVSAGSVVESSGYDPNDESTFNY